MQTNENGRRHVDGLIIGALATGASYADAARIARVSKATVARRMAEPAFRGRVATERERVCEQVRGVLLEGSLDAARSIVELAGGSTNEGVRLSASCRLLDLTLRRRPGFDIFTAAELQTVLRELIELALARIPQEEQEGFLLEVRGIGAA